MENTATGGSEEEGRWDALFDRQFGHCRYRETNLRRAGGGGGARLGDTCWTVASVDMMFAFWYCRRYGLGYGVGGGDVSVGGEPSAG